MAKNKDPAVLFYTSDFLADTVLWSYDELGRYIKLLCIQHLQDGILEDDFNAVVDGKNRVKSKFNLCDDGLFRNERMKFEADKRREFCEKQRANGLKPKGSQKEANEKPKGSQSETRAIGNENENINENINVNSNKTIKHKYGIYNNVLLSDDDLEKLKAEFPDYIERIERLSEYIASSGKSYKSHLATIRSWARKEPPKPIMKEKSFDVDKSFENALKRSYGDLKPLAK